MRILTNKITRQRSSYPAVRLSRSQLRRLPSPVPCGAALVSCSFEADHCFPQEAPPFLAATCKHEHSDNDYGTRWAINDFTVCLAWNQATIIWVCSLENEICSSSCFVAALCSPFVIIRKAGTRTPDAVQNHSLGKIPHVHTLRSAALWIVDTCSRRTQHASNHSWYAPVSQQIRPKGRSYKLAHALQ